MTGPLQGRTVLVTRPRASELSELLRARGARPVEAPTIRTGEAPAGGPLDQAVRDAARGRYDWVVFTSAAGVESWFGRARALRAGPSRARIAAIGTATAQAISRAGAAADLVPGTFTTEALARAFPSGSGRVVLARADLADAELEDVLRAKGWEAVRIDAYRTTFEDRLPGEARAVLDSGGVDAVTFTSTSTVEGFVRLAGVVEVPVVACIGPVTAEAARRAGFRVDAVAEPHTLEGLVDALGRAFDGGGA